MKRKKGKLLKCPVCPQQFKAENLDKHMHNLMHHQAIEKLQGRNQMHKCWACEIYVLGLKQFERHIATTKHITNLGFLQKERFREDGFKVDYNDDELNALCAKRDQNQLHKKKENLENKKAIKASQSKKSKWQRKKTQKTSNSAVLSDHQHANQPLQSVLLHSNHDQKVPNLGQNLIQEAGEEANEHKSNQIVGCNSFIWEQSGSHYLKDDVDFTSDVFTSSQGLIFSSHEEDEVSLKQSEEKSQKRLPDEDPSSDSSHVKRTIRTNFSSLNLKSDMNGRYFSFNEGTESELGIQTKSSDNPSQSLPASGLVHRHVDSSLTPITNSTEKDHGLLIHSSANSNTFRAGGVEEVNKYREEPKPKPAIKPAIKPIKTALKKSKHVKKANKKSSELSVLPYFAEYSADKIDSSNRQHNTDKLKAKTKRNSSSLMKPSGDSPAVSIVTLLKEKKTDLGKEAHCKHGLPALLSRSISKMEACRPNLSLARGIHTSQGPECESKVLKPALQTLISSKSSRWSLNWKEIYQEATNRKLERKKGMPRFGIELVNPFSTEPLVLEEVKDIGVDESFWWNLVNADDVPGSSTSEKACASKPTEATSGQSIEKDDSETSNLTPHSMQSMKSKIKKGDAGRKAESASKKQISFGSFAKVVGGKEALAAEPAFETHNAIIPGFSLLCGKAEMLDDFGTGQFQSSDAHCRFGPGRHVKKEKRDAPNTSNTHTGISKRKVNELMVVFQREDALSSYLEDVNSQLLLAQAALHSAFSNIQHLQEIKQQMTAQMTSLRTERIAILLRMQREEQQT